jgi:hypothetical protein
VTTTTKIAKTVEYAYERSVFLFQPTGRPWNLRINAAEVIGANKMRAEDATCPHNGSPTMSPTNIHRYRAGMNDTNATK